MIAILKNLIVDPAAAFTDVEKKLTPQTAGAIVALSGLLGAAPVVAAIREPIAVGIILMLLWKTAIALFAWLVAGLAGHFVASRLMRGIGSLRATLTALGLATVPHVFEGVVGTGLVLAGHGESPFLMVFFGWHTVLVIIALREVHDIHTPRAILAAFVLGIVVFAGLAATAPVEWYVYPHLTHEPFRQADPGWEEADLPDEVTQWLHNGGFEATAPEDEAQLIRSAMRMGSDVDLPLGWTPFSYLARPRKNRDVLQLNRLRVDFARDTSTAHGGRASALVERAGPRVGPPVAWGWAQAVGTKRLQAKYLEDLDKAESEEQRQALRQFMDRMEKCAILDVGDGGDAYVAAILRGEDVCAATLMVYVHVEDSRQPLLHTAGTLHGTFDWTELRLRAGLPANTHGVVVVVLLWGGGRLWLDDMRLLYPQYGPEELTPDEDALWAPLKAPG